MHYNGKDMSQFTNILLSVALVMVSAIIHEVSHGWVAYKLGDNTAKNAGRLTLNPASHIDPVGSILLPLVMTAFGGPVFAFAKPVPYNPNNLKNPKRDEVLVALAGPLSNLIQASIAALILRLVFEPLVSWATTTNTSYAMGVASTVIDVFSTYIYVNLILMLFNLIPLPPLDGSSLIFPFLKGKARESYYKIQASALPILLLVMYAFPALLHIDPLGAYLNYCSSALYRLLLGV